MREQGERAVSRGRPASNPTRRRVRRDEVTPRDSGSALVLTMVLVVLCALIIVPTLAYGQAVIAQSQVVRARAARLEAVKGGLRVALADPKELYTTCNDSSAGVALASPLLDQTVATRCYKISEATATDNGRFGVATVAVASAPPAESAHSYPLSGQSPSNLWVADTADGQAANKIWLPILPTLLKTPRSSTPYAMPSSYGACQVFFPGSYSQQIELTSATKTYFASGVYYFTKPVYITDGAQVVIGGGAKEGCASDQEAAFDAVGAPQSHGITGLGATFIFGAGGLLRIASGSTGSALSVVFNERYVPSTDVLTPSTASVSIMTVNGARSGTSLIDLTQLDKLFVPASRALNGGTTQLATEQGYEPSDQRDYSGGLPVVSINVSKAGAFSVVIPGYVAVPQGAIQVNVATGQQAGSDIEFLGGALASRIMVSTQRAQTFVFDLRHAVCQRTFRIVTTSTAPGAKVTSTAVVQVNQNGAYAVNQWSVA